MVRPSTAPGMPAENAKCLKCTADGGMPARRGSVVAFRGAPRFERRGQGPDGMLKRALTGRGCR
ncbi:MULTISPECIES: hypothetical protein [Streptomyces]|jgi:hypothetical protein|uniref:Uncharacterized protein n=1 Tax=Streptomyces thermogriseus TaxID=75292 RepID=A0ABP4DJG2_9ACTN